MTAQGFEIGPILNQLRSQRKETLHQVATGTDIDSPMLSKLERGRRLPTDSQIERLAAYFDVPVDRLKAITTAQKILRDYGENHVTYTALRMVCEKLAPYTND